LNDLQLSRFNAILVKLRDLDRDLDGVPLMREDKLEVAQRQMDCVIDFVVQREKLRHELLRCVAGNRDDAEFLIPSLIWEVVGEYLWN
jgi:hypothetical protein